jgi:hypothetical protein
MFANFRIKNRPDKNNDIKIGIKSANLAGYECWFTDTYLKNKKLWEELIAYLPTYDTDASNNSYIVSCAFVAAVTFLPSRCLAMIGIHM